MKLYEIEQAIIDCVDLETGEVFDIDAFSELQIEKTIKIDNISCLYKELTAESIAIKEEIKALSQRQKSKESNAERIKEWLAGILDGEKFETSRTLISWRKSESINILDVNAIGEDFKEYVETVKVDKAGIKTAIKQGVEILGVELQINKNIQIK